MRYHSLAPYRKAVRAVIGGIAQLVASGSLHGQALAIATSIIGLATALGVYQATNSEE